MCGWEYTVPLEGSTIAVVDLSPLRATVKARGNLVDWGFFLSHTGHDVKCIVVGLDVAWLWLSYADCCFILVRGCTVLTQYYTSRIPYFDSICTLSLGYVL